MIIIKKKKNLCYCLCWAHGLFCMFISLPLSSVTCYVLLFSYLFIFCTCTFPTVRTNEPCNDQKVLLKDNNNNNYKMYIVKYIFLRPEQSN